MALRDEIRAERAKLAGKGFKYKWNYFWTYYTTHVVVIVVVGLIIFSIIRTIVNQKDTAYYVAFFNSATVPVTENFEDYLNIDRDEEEVIFDNSYTIRLQSGGDSESYTSLQKFMASIASESVDAAIGEGEVIKFYAENEIYADLRDYYDEEFLDSLGKKLIYTTYTDEETGVISDPIPVAINVKDAPITRGCFPMEDVYLAFLVNSPHPEYNKDFYDYIYSDANYELENSFLDDVMQQSDDTAQ